MARFTIGSASPSGLLTLLGASALALGLAYVVPGGAAATPADGAETATPRSPAVWRMTNHVANASCEARPGPHISSTFRAVEIEESCRDVLPTLASAVLWREDRDGSIALVDETGKLLIAFAHADGYALEALEPRDAMISLAAL